MFIRLHLSWATLLIATMPLAASATTVTGHINLANSSTARNAVIWLQGSEHPKPLPNATVDQRNLTFIPHISVVTVGTTVHFPNNDTVYHNVFAEFEAKKFDLGMYPKGSTKNKTFDKAGIVALMCSVHSNMSAYIMVVDTPFYATADKNGNFSIKDVPPGNYKLRVWHESNQTYDSPTSISGGQQNLSIQTSRK